MARLRTSKPKQTFSISVPAPLYQKILEKAGRGSLNSLINLILEEKLIKEEKSQKERLIAAYKRMIKNRNLQAELAVLERGSVKDIAKKLTKDE